MIRKINISTPKIKKKDVKNINPSLFKQSNQVSMTNQLYLNEDFEDKKRVSNAIKKKLNSYKSQDTKKNKYIHTTFIKYNDVLEKLVISRLLCKYCRVVTLIMYENKREPTQWTLDRIDNALGHSNANTVICCLKCNLNRRCINDEKFKFTKQMRLIKKNKDK